MTRYLFDVKHEIDTLQRELVRMDNQDYSLDEIIYQYMAYRRNRHADLLRRYQYRGTPLDNDDAEILYLYCMRFYRELDTLLMSIDRPIKNICLSRNFHTLIVEIDP